MYKYAADIVNAVGLKYEKEHGDDFAEKHAEDFLADILAEISKLNFNDLNKLAGQYLGKKYALEAANEMGSDNTYRQFLEELVFKAGFEYGH